MAILVFDTSRVAPYVKPESFDKRGHAPGNGAVQFGEHTGRHYRKAH